MTSDAETLAEIEEVIRIAPPAERLRGNSPEAFSWLGRAKAALYRWDMARSVPADSHIDALRNPFAIGGGSGGYSGLMILLHEARSDLRNRTIGPITAAFGQGLVFDYFDGLRRQIETAKTDRLVVDRYLDAEFVSKYLPHVTPGTEVRLLTRNTAAALVPAVRLFSEQSGLSIRVRTNAAVHDRFIFIDDVTCFQSGASFKDGGKHSPTTLTQVVDAFPAIRDTYEGMWQAGKEQ